MIGEFVNRIKGRRDLRTQIAIFALAVVFFARCAASVEIVRADHVVWSGLWLMAFYAVGSYMGAAFVLTFATFAWLLWIEPYLRHLIRSPRETLMSTIVVIVISVFMSWFGAFISRGPGSFCELEPRGGVYCIED